MTEATKTYEVGFGRPPRHTRFKAGQSGNPKGKPKKAVSLATDVQNELAERIAIREGEKSLRVSKQRALIKALLARATSCRKAGLSCNSARGHTVVARWPHARRLPSIWPERDAAFRRHR